MLFVAIWNQGVNGQRIIWIDPRRVTEEGYTPGMFMTGLIRPTDVIMDADGSLLVADYNYGLVWRVRYGESSGQPTPGVLATLGIQPMAATAAPTLNPNSADATLPAPSGFATNTPSAP
jgi:hypothetical protein